MPRVGQTRRRDQTEASIVRALRQAGAEVIRLNDPGVPDLLVLRGRQIYLLEIKTARGHLTPAQQQRALRGWPVHVVRSVDEAFKALERAKVRENLLGACNGDGALQSRPPAHV